MSAIWGAISMKKMPLMLEVEEMQKSYQKCVIDSFKSLKEKEIYMGCGIQYFTPQAKDEKLPIQEEEIYFDADVVLDNRREIIHRLDMIEAECTQIPDGTLLFWMYQRYGKGCLNLIRGVYSFVYYNKKENLIEIVTDVTGDRCLYYMIKDDVFYYSTLIEPLKQIQGNATYNERWLVDFLGMDHLFMINELEETPVKEIYRVAPAQYIRVEDGKLEKEFYWEPLKDFQELQLGNDEAYRAEFRKLWKAAVKDTMRSEDEISILLSGGMDSSAVACVAAPILKKQKRLLHSYTSVPIKDYTGKDTRYEIPDESENVKKTKEYLGNVECTFVDMPTIDPWQDHREELEAMEMPYKSVQNLLWIRESLKMAYEKGSRIMLGGSYGNSSISFTDLEVYMNTLYRKKKFLKLWKELTAFQKHFGFSRKYALKKIHDTMKDRGEKSEQEDIFGHSYLKEEMRESSGAKARLKELYSSTDERLKEFEQFRLMMEDRKPFRQIGEIVTKHSLDTGVLQRDPTRDKRILDFCIHLPIEQFVKNGEDRRLVRVYLKDIIPEHVMTYTQKGKQSADLVERMKKQWDKTYKEWTDLYMIYMENNYVDCKKALNDLKKIKDLGQANAFELTRHMYTLFCLEYMEGFKGE